MPSRCLGLGFLVNIVERIAAIATVHLATIRRIQLDAGFEPTSAAT